MFLALMCLGVAAFFIGKIIVQEREYQKGDSAYEVMEELVVEPAGDSDSTSESASNERNEQENKQDSTQDQTPNINFDALEEFTGDAIGWLYLPDRLRK